MCVEIYLRVTEKRIIKTAFPYVNFLRKFELYQKLLKIRMGMQGLQNFTEHPKMKGKLVCSIKITNWF